jgi:hypothetical protein
MALTRNRIIKQVVIQVDAGTIEVQWADQVKDSAELIGEKFHRKSYTAEQKSELDADIPAGLAQRVKQAVGWVG